MNVPAFLKSNGNGGHAPDTAQLDADIRSLPHPRSDPLNPAVADLMSKAILESGEAYVQSILAELERNAKSAAELLEQGKAWAQGERARFHARAQDCAEAHQEMQATRNKFLALPRAPTPPEPTHNPVPTAADYAQLSG